MAGGQQARIGLIGCGKISSIYLQNLGAFAGSTVVACADIDQVRAQEQAAQFAVPRDVQCRGVAG